MAKVPICHENPVPKECFLCFSEIIRIITNALMCIFLCGVSADMYIGGVEIVNPVSACGVHLAFI